MKAMKVNVLRLCGAAVAVLLALIGSAAGQEGTTGQEDLQADNPPARVARLSYIRGNVSFLRAGVDQWSAAALNFPVTTGDRIYTDSGARAELEVGNYTVRLSEHTDLTVTNLNDQILQLGLQQGTLRVSVYRLPAGDTVEVDTPNSAVTVVEPGDTRVQVDPDGATTLAVYRGSVDVTGSGISQTVQAGQAVKLSGYDNVALLSMQLPRSDDFDRWCQDRDLRISSSRSTQYVSPAVPGFDDLDDYGSWEDVADYGPVWYPAGVAVDWVPYRFGRWVWVGPWGWTWIEAEPWAFCQFHYGRWVHIGLRWGWLPGPIVPVSVYAPAFVAFIGGPNFAITIGGGPVSLTAWFPLGPGEPFFPWYHCRETYIRQVNITNIRIVTNITNIINVTNINNVHYAYRSIATTAVPANVFRSGLPVARQVVRLTPQQIEHAQIIPHPYVNPTLRAALPGKPVSPPLVRPHPSLTAARGAPVRGPTGVRAPSELPRTATVSERAPRVAPAPIPAPRLFTRVPPPPPNVPFTVQRPYMAPHPGRYLEPQQLESLRAGRPAGPMVDHEFPPHVAPPPHVVAPAPHVVTGPPARVAPPHPQRKP
ncbi:MAG TPA: DUF6600 domain-containing protein [Candidatus Acidoferrum sp.]|jgi:hypothetical protein